MSTIEQSMKRLPIFNSLVRWVKSSIYKPVSSGGEFKKRILHRHSTFWNDPNAEAVRNTSMGACDPISKWKDAPNWQRKLSNKHNAREFAKMYGCKVADLYWKGKDVQALDFSSLPSSYVIRPTIGFSSNLVFLMKDGVNMMDDKTYSDDEIRKILVEAGKLNPNIEFLFEEFLQTESGETKIPNDYKFYIFNGHIAAIQLINRLSPSKGYTTFYDEQWRQADVVNTYYPIGSYEETPNCFQEMVDKVKELSRAYEIFARIDFYATPKGAVFGEFTPTPFKGSHFTTSAEKMFIEFWDKYCPGKI